MKQTLYINIGPMGFASEKQCTMTVLRGHTKFYVKVETAQIKDTHFGEELLEQIKLGQGNPFGKYALSLLYQHCLPLLQRLAPQTSLPDVALESFLHSPTYHLKLVGTGVGGNILIEGEDRCSFTPAFSISPMQTTHLPISCKAVPHYQACKTWLAPITRDEEKSLDSLQGKVTTSDGATMYFKPRYDLRESHFERELEIMSRIEEAGLSARIRVPRLQGIVVTGEHGESTMGLLMTMITSPAKRLHLQSPAFHGQPEMHKKWEEQVTEIVRELHANEIVWGDVNPMNVVIDEEMNAWVIDFGGSNNVQFVDDKNRETVEGDWQGVKKLFQEWLPSQYQLLKEKRQETASSQY